VAHSIFVAGTTLKDSEGTTLDVSDQDDGEIAISVDGGDKFVFKAAESDAVISAIREMADRVKKRTGVPDKAEDVKEAVVRDTRARR